MKMTLPQQIDRKQWLDRLGVTGEMPEGLEIQLKTAEKKLLGAAIPQGTYRVMTPEAFDLPGKAIKKHLAECDGMIIMAVTLGAAVDRLIRMSQVKDMAEAVILDSGASVLAEQCADILEETIKDEIRGNVSEESKTTPIYFTGRYSPGYGDFPIEIQGKFIKNMDCPKTIGLTTNESHILIPRKSITAIIGTADHQVAGYLATCDECQIKNDCRMRADGRPCYMK